MTSRTPLFRRQALQARTSTLAGEPSLASPVSVRLLVAVAAVAALALLTTVFFGTYTRKETVTGFVTTTEANIRIYPSVSGTISELFAIDGQRVTQGDALAKISTSRVSEGARSVQETLLRSMNQEADALARQISNTVRIGENQDTGLHRQIESALYQIGVMKAQHASATARLDLARINRQRYEKLRKAGLIAELDLDNSRARLLDLKVAMHQLDRDLATQRDALERLRLDKLQLPSVNASRVGELETKRQQLEQRIAGVQGQVTVLIVAPVDGRVSNLGRRVGQRVFPDTPIFSVLPVDASYSVELYVPSRSIGFVSPGTEVQLRYDAYPHQKFGVYGGTVVSIGTTPVRPHEADAAIAVVEPSYLLTVYLNDQSVVADGLRRSLAAGMTLQADIVQDRRRIIEWILDPLVGAVKRSR